MDIVNYPYFFQCILGNLFSNCAAKLSFEYYTENETRNTQLTNLCVVNSEIHLIKPPYILPGNYVWICIMNIFSIFYPFGTNPIHFFPNLFAWILFDIERGYMIIFRFHEANIEWDVCQHRLCATPEALYIPFALWFYVVGCFSRYNTYLGIIWLPQSHWLWVNLKLPKLHCSNAW